MMRRFLLQSAVNVGVPHRLLRLLASPSLSAPVAMRPKLAAAVVPLKAIAKHLPKSLQFTKKRLTSAHIQATITKQLKQSIKRVGKGCPHGRQRSRCKSCGGSEICTHGRIRSQCKPCGGSQICIHGRQRAFCKPCCGSQICRHGKFRTWCKVCKR